MKLTSNFFCLKFKSMTIGMTTNTIKGIYLTVVVSCQLKLHWRKTNHYHLIITKVYFATYQKTIISMIYFANIRIYRLLGSEICTKYRDYLQYQKHTHIIRLDSLLLFRCQISWTHICRILFLKFEMHFLKLPTSLS